jgi:hypothetical protein
MNATAEAPTVAPATPTAPATPAGQPAGLPVYMSKIGSQDVSIDPSRNCFGVTVGVMLTDPEQFAARKQLDAITTDARAEVDRAGADAITADPTVKELAARIERMNLANASYVKSIDELVRARDKATREAKRSIANGDDPTAAEQLAAGLADQEKVARGRLEQSKEATADAARELAAAKARAKDAARADLAAKIDPQLNAAIKAAVGPLLAALPDIYKLRCLLDLAAGRPVLSPLLDTGDWQQ